MTWMIGEDKVSTLLLLPPLRILTGVFITIGVNELNLRHIVVVRTDRIGDVLLTLPTVEAIRSAFPNARISMLVREYTAPLVEGNAHVLLYDEKRPFFETLRQLRLEHIDAAVVAYPRFRLALLLWFARIPVRVGSGYRWYSFLFNRKVYEHRKRVEKHEAAYNLSLAKELGCNVPEHPTVRLSLSEEVRRRGQEIRKTLGIDEHSTMIVLHPGSGKSARDWKPERFTELACELSNRNYAVVVTGGKSEEALVKLVAEKAGRHVRAFVSTVCLKEFAAFIQTASLFVANSTGPLHMAAAVGVPVIGFYPPVQVMSPKRWGPLTEKKKIFVPDKNVCRQCHGRTCRGNNCMDQIDAHTVAEAAMELIGSPHQVHIPREKTA